MLERIAGNAALRQDLAGALAAGRLAHSIMLVGEKGCGTGFAARCLAADYLYPAGGPHAEAVLRGEDSECIVVRGTPPSWELKIGPIREARREILNSALSDAAGRVMFLYGVEKMNTNAGNALLKILEEPPEGALFLLTASSAAAVLPTIRSRCVCYTIAPAPLPDCAALLRQHHPALAAADAEDLAFLYEGHIGSCLAALESEDAMAALAQARKLAPLIAAEDTYRVLAALSAVGKDKELAERQLRQLRCLASGALRRAGYAGLPPAKAAAVIRAVDDALPLLVKCNLPLLLTGFGSAITQG